MVRKLLHVALTVAGLLVFCFGLLLAPVALSAPRPAPLEVTVTCLVLWGGGLVLLIFGPAADEGQGAWPYPSRWGCAGAGFFGSASVGLGTSVAARLIVANAWVYSIAGIVVFAAAWIWSWMRTSLADED